MPESLTPEDAALMGLPVLDRGDPRHWDATELQEISLGALFRPWDEDHEDADHDGEIAT
ncbi:hypothetical protein [Streptomyces sp. NRRL S-1813]|uniref:hypothetical protein n=1 Tax=Streptomyces sp. NRRL S-1813 TaxID=1463888 RepID=UPI000A45B4FA|nr:hypothetical protein [Streptomyces sp. NRRL S-1813]